MKINIKLNQANGRLSNRDPFIVTDNDSLELDFTVAIKYDELIIAMRNGDAESKLKYSGKTVTVPRELYTAGLLEMRVAVITKGQTVKELDVEPITLREVLNGFSGQPEFDRLIAEIEKLNKTISRLAIKINENQTATNKAVEQLAAIIDSGKVL